MSSASCGRWLLKTSMNLSKRDCCCRKLLAAGLVASSSGSDVCVRDGRSTADGRAGCVRCRFPGVTIRPQACSSSSSSVQSRHLTTVLGRMYALTTATRNCDCDSMCSILSTTVVRFRSVTHVLWNHAVEARDDADDRNVDARENVGRGGKN
jgi:hypothetical protein